jgi:hypothetical protein
MIAAACLTLFLASAAPPLAGAPAGTIDHIDGPTDDEVVTVKNGEATMSAAEDDQVFEGDQILTGPDQTVSLVLNDESEIVVGPSSSFHVNQAYEAAHPSTYLALAAGLIHAYVRKIYSEKSPFIVETPEAAMGVRGTEFVVEHDAASGESNVHTLDGSVALASSPEQLHDPSKHALIPAGSMSTYRRGMARPAPPRAFNRAQLFQRLHKRSPRFVRHVRTRAQVRAHRATWPKRVHRKKRPRRKPPARRRVAHRGKPGARWGK